MTPFAQTSVRTTTIRHHTERDTATTAHNARLREAGLAKSNSEGRRLIRGGGARVNDERFRDETGTVGPDDLTAEGTIKLSAGRKRHALVRVS